VQILSANMTDWLLQGRPRPSGRIALVSRKDAYGRNDALLPSGLPGPVTLRVASE
jgi:hypothetical protein